MRNKVLALLLVYFLVGLIFSCGVCDDVKYRDFSEVEIRLKNQLVLANDSLLFQVSETDIDFLAYAHPVSGMGNMLYALNCNEGFGGPKYPIVNFEITSSADFDEDHPAASLLNDLVTMNVLVAGGQHRYQKLSETDLNLDLDSDYYIKRRPTKSKTHRLKIAIYKSNGEVVQAESDEIVWE